MTSARRRKLAVKKKRSSRVSLIKILVLLLVLVLGFLYFRLNTKYWRGKEKIGIAIQKENDPNISVVLSDPDVGEVTEFIIPGETEVEVSQNLGTIRIKNVFKLGINEKIGGQLLPKTITKSFLFPVYLWSDKMPDDLKFVLTKNSNIPVGDRLAIFLFAKKMKNVDKSTIDLGKSQFLVRAKLSDGTLGYRIPGEISERLTFYFADSDFSEKGVRVYIKDASGTFGTAERMGKIVEVMGAKVVSLEKIPKQETACILRGNNKEALIKISRVFDCKVERGSAEFDVEITLGSKFLL